MRMIPRRTDPAPPFPAVSVFLVFIVRKLLLIDPRRSHLHVKKRADVTQWLDHRPPSRMSTHLPRLIAARHVPDTERFTRGGTLLERFFQENPGAFRYCLGLTVAVSLPEQIRVASQDDSKIS